MDSSRFPFTDDELKAAGLLGDDVSPEALQVIKTMKEYPDLLELSLFSIQCVDFAAKHKALSSTLSDESSRSGITLATKDNDPTLISEYEKTAFYHGIAADGDHPPLLYRSDLLTNPFPKPSKDGSYIPTKSVQGVFNTPLNKVWDTVGPQIRDLVKHNNIRYSSIDPARFTTYGEDDAEALGPVVIWVGVYPGSTSPSTAQKVSQDILALLVENGVEHAVVEWRESAPYRLIDSR